jgi:hypothetical protein|tara:strand:- start:436 stop:951 length:516 start_codon:yes stop_codon:yes gene_type:complete
MSKLKRPAFVRDGVGVIRLTQGYEAIVDLDMLPILGAKNWHVSGSDITTNAYAKRKMTLNGKKKPIYLHREVLRYHGINIPEGMVTDHINRNSLDNRFENLRVITVAMNFRNSDKWNKSIGSTLRMSKHGKVNYQARIRIGKKQISIGHYLTQEEAHEAYLKEAEKMGRML